jgi:hypothetical protein
VTTFYGTAYSSFTFQVQDNGGTLNSGKDTDPTARTMTLSVTEVNHAPSGSNKTVTILENTPYLFKTTDFPFSDPNDNPANNLKAVEITTKPGLGSLTDNGVAVTAGQFVPVADITGGKLVYTPVTTFYGTAYSSFTFQVQDNGGTLNSGHDTDPTARTMTLSVIEVNHAPSGTSGTVTGPQDRAYTFKTSDFGFTDVNDSPANLLLAVKIVTLPGSGSLIDNGVAVTTNQFVSATDISNGKLNFTPPAKTTGVLFLCKFQVEDNGGTANGGVNLDPTAKVLDINLLHVNHAPSGTSGTVTGIVNAPYIFKTSDFGFTDPNDTPPNLLLAVKVGLLPGAGTLSDNGTSVTANQFVSAADISSGKLIFTPMVSATGVNFLCKFQVEDNGGTANGGVNLDPIAKILDINLVHGNHAPVGAAHTVTMSKNTTYTFKVADFGFADPNDSPPNSFLAVKITTLPLLGTLTDNGVAVTAGAHITVADITAGKLKFAPATNGTGTAYASFTFQVQDNGGTVNGAIDTDPTSRKMTISVN